MGVEGVRDGRRDELVRLLQGYASESVRVGQVFAERHGLHPTDLNAMLAVMQAELEGPPLTPGLLGEQLGLSSGATTAVIDRLERFGHVVRTREHTDRRRVTLRYGDTAAAIGREFFGPLGARMDTMLTAFSDAELDVVVRFLSGTTRMLGEHRAAASS
ncbi:MAG: MarR family transcriptional regulator [Pseudonocardia sp.]|nr:MarR family transcriptional regulator [Pseudonocardia sp.]